MSSFARFSSVPVISALFALSLRALEGELNFLFSEVSSNYLVRKKVPYEANFLLKTASNRFLGETGLMLNG